MKHTVAPCCFARETVLTPFQHAAGYRDQRIRALYRTFAHPLPWQKVVLERQACFSRDPLIENIRPQIANIQNDWNVMRPSKLHGRKCQINGWPCTKNDIRAGLQRRKARKRTAYLRVIYEAGRGDVTLIAFGGQKDHFRSIRVRAHRCRVHHIAHDLELVMKTTRPPRHMMPTFMQSLRHEPRAKQTVPGFCRKMRDWFTRLDDPDTHLFSQVLRAR